MQIIGSTLAVLGLVILLGDAASPAERPKTTDSATVTATAYNPRRGARTASGKPVGPGMLALSPDLEKRLDLQFGDRLRLEGLGTYTFQDRTSAARRDHADVFVGSAAAARKFGARRVQLTVVSRRR